MILTILMLLTYLVIGVSTVLLLRNRLLDILRVISGIALLLLVTVQSINITNPDAVIIFALAVCIFMSIELASFKENKGDRRSLYLIYAFTLMLTAVLTIMLLTI